MSKTYRIRPLNWFKTLDESKTIHADTLLGYYSIWPTTGSRCAWQCRHADKWLATTSGNAPSLEAAKLAAENHWRERIEQALEVVE